MKRILFAALFLCACTLDNVGQSADSSSSSAADPDATRVFAATKGSANNSTVLGIWEGAKPETSGPLSSTSRFEFRESFVVAAARCTRTGSDPLVVGGRSPAQVSSDLISIDQAISDVKTIGGDAQCGVQASAGSLPACDPGTPPASRTTCFDLTGTTLDIYQGSAGIQSFVKISD
jgi:hypothetical protein